MSFEGGGNEELSSSMEVETLVALDAANNLTTTPTAPRRGTEKHQLVLIPEERHEERTAHIVDAFAAILVHAPRHEAYAVGIQVNFSDSGCVTLTVSGNQDVPASLVNYIHKVWDILANLSLYYKREFKGPGQLYSQITPPKNPLDDQEHKEYKKLTEGVYNHCLPKFLRRIHKHHSEVVAFCEGMVPRAASKGMDSTGEKIKGLYYVFRSLMEIYDMGESKLLSSLSDETFLKRITNSCLWIQGLEKNQEWVQALFGIEYDNVWRHLKKATALQASILNFNRLARSRRMSSVLRKKLNVHCLGLHEGNTQPESENNWKTIINKSLGEGNEMEKIENAMKIPLKDHAGKKSLVHCELKILEHFASQSAKTPPISYIGTSKLACMGCWMVVEAWNKAHQSSKYVLRGSHGKWYFPWAIPTLGSEPLINRIRQDVKGAVIQCIKESHLYRVKSDSSAPSNDEELMFPDDDSFDKDFEEREVPKSDLQN
ncbi:hypothetical protein AJ79_07895 [Helicocarpus griseus UAMH5409]|uniref:Uncharacterized protein n=1 Tax=Helicocarpus griseus UAMH5409 TaxID=1447875 RepID=A0A2B7WY96_9EURO|nr:hypothetical protein AJ79_07895 [Helicocarpus griseus UAMH5409]